MYNTMEPTQLMRRSHWTIRIEICLLQFATFGETSDLLTN